MLDRSPKPKVLSPAPPRASSDRVAAPSVGEPAQGLAAVRFDLDKIAFGSRGGRPKPRPNHVGLPETLKAGVETLSGVAMDEVRVRYRSPEPARFGALAFARGRDIHLGPGQEHHLPHEAWHVVQQARGRVKATESVRGSAINHDRSLEHDATVSGHEATQGAASGHRFLAKASFAPASSAVSQMVFGAAGKAIGRMRGRTKALAAGLGGVLGAHVWSRYATPPEDAEKSHFKPVRKNFIEAEPKLRWISDAMKPGRKQLRQDHPGDDYGTQVHRGQLHDAKLQFLAMHSPPEGKQLTPKQLVRTVSHSTQPFFKSLVSQDTSVFRSFERAGLAAATAGVGAANLIANGPTIPTPFTGDDAYRHSDMNFEDEES